MDRPLPGLGTYRGLLGAPFVSWLCLAAFGLFPSAQTRAAAFAQQFCSFSRSRQFAVYCSDSSARFAIASAAEEIKSGVLSVLDQKDQWKAPIVINVRREDPTSPNAPISTVKMVELDQGFKVELEIRLGDKPQEAHFQEQLVKAILLEFAYRNRPPVPGGTEYIEPPEWMVQGIIQLLLKRANGTEMDIFKNIIDTNRVMPLRKFVQQKSVDLDSSSLALYQAYSLCMVKLLSQSNNGAYHLAEFLRILPASNGDPVADISKAFPDLGKSEQAMEKWWSLSIARLSTENRYRGLSLEETEKRMNEALKVGLVETSGTIQTTQVVELANCKEWIKKKPAQAAIGALNTRLLELSAIAHPLMRGILGEYQEVVRDLSRGKTRGVLERLAKLADRRGNVVKLMSDIEDTMNWFEATQMNVKTNAFDAFLSRSKKGEAVEHPPRTDQISLALDAVEAELK